MKTASSMNEYYAAEANSFYNRSVDLDLSEAYHPFETNLKSSFPDVTGPLRIIDAGCGSLRDSRYFAGRGYEVEAFDQSAELIDIARSKHAMRFPVTQDTFLSWAQRDHKPFHGLWASASLLHVPEAELAHTLSCLLQHLVHGAVIYCSFKLGQGERQTPGRRFTDLTRESLLTLAASIDGVCKLTPIHVQESESMYRGNEQRWVRGYFKKRERNPK